MIDIGHNIATDIFFYGSNFELQNQRRVVGKIIKLQSSFQLNDLSNYPKPWVMWAVVSEKDNRRKITFFKQNGRSGKIERPNLGLLKVQKCTVWIPATMNDPKYPWLNTVK